MNVATAASRQEMCDINAAATYASSRSVSNLRYHQLQRKQLRPEQRQAKSCSGLRIRCGAARVIIGRSRDYPGTQAQPSRETRRAAARDRMSELDRQQSLLPRVHLAKQSC